MHYSWS